MGFAQVVISNTHRWSEGHFTYLLPEELQGQVCEGSAVLVPFGDTETVGFVVRLFEQPPELDAPLKSIHEVVAGGPLWTSELLELSYWMSEFYACSLGEAMQAVVPPVIVRRHLRPVRGRERSQAEAGLGQGSPRHPLNLEQAEAVQAIGRARTDRQTLLLEGITGSGKTEVYLSALEHVLEAGSTAIVLIPEISLTPQAIDRYLGRLGDRVAVLHSQLGETRRTREWQRLLRGEARLALGTRSAIFAPLENLGLVVIDEEHDASYKQDQSPRYHARQVAAWRVQRSASPCALVLGSATPCLETYGFARTGRFRHQHLHQRAAGNALPEVDIVDLRKHRLAPGESLSVPLIVALRAALKRQEQSVLLFNRRGFCRYLQCQECGKVVHCPHCSISLTLHLQPRRELLCHYCSFQASPPDHCPACGTLQLREQGSGTERIELELRQRIPQARILRMDRDTTRRQGSHSQLLGNFARGEADILLGTQMVAKGLDFPRVTLVGVVGADQGLHLPDFRAAERTLQLLVQVAGRAGRAEHAGRVLMQVLDGSHPLMEFVQKHDYRGFLDLEMGARKELGYPPFCRLGRMVISAPKEAQVEKSAATLKDWLAQRAGSIQVLGPAPCPLEKLQGNYRWHFLFKARGVKELAEMLRNALRQCKRGSNVRWAADIDPQTLL